MFLIQILTAEIVYCMNHVHLYLAVSFFLSGIKQLQRANKLKLYHSHYIVYTSGCLLIPAHENKSCLGAENLTCDVH